MPITCGPNKKRASGGAEEDSARATCTGSSESGGAGEADWFIGELASRLPKPYEFAGVPARRLESAKGLRVRTPPGPTEGEGAETQSQQEALRPRGANGSGSESSESPSASESEERERRSAR